MDIVLVETSNVSPHLETGLELALRHVNTGDRVYYFFVGHSVSYSEFVVNSWKRKLLAGLPEYNGSKLISSSRFIFKEPSRAEVMRTHQLPVFSYIEDLKQFQYHNYRVGLAALSSLVSLAQDPEPNLLDNKEILEAIINSGISIYNYCMKIFSQVNPDLVYLFNGRFANNRAIMDAAIESRVSYQIHERGANKNKYFLKPFAPHNLPKLIEDMFELWKARSNNANHIAEEYFSNRRRGADLEWVSFTKNQVKGKLPLVGKEAKRLVAYYSSSEDEFVAAGDYYKWTMWPSQFAAASDLIDVVARNQDLFLVIRLHPHLAFKSSRELEHWKSIRLPTNCALIMPDEKIDSYALIDCSDVVVTSGSTVGIEAVFWGKPSICLGPSLYSHLDAVYLPANKLELEKMLVEDDLKSNPSSALIYGYYFSTFGEDFMYYSADTLFAGKFLGVDLQASWLSQLNSFIKKMLKHVS